MLRAKPVKRHAGVITDTLNKRLMNFDRHCPKLPQKNLLRHADSLPTLPKI